MKSNGQEKICVICASDCSTAERFKDDDGNYYHKVCYENSFRSGLDQTTATRGLAPASLSASNARQEHQTTTEREKEIPLVTKLLKRIGWGVFYGIVGVLMGMAGPSFQGSTAGHIRINENPDSVSMGGLSKAMIVFGLFFSIGGFLFGARGWSKLNDTDLTVATLRNPVALILILIGIVLILVVAVELYRL